MTHHHCALHLATSHTGLKPYNMCSSLMRMALIDLLVMPLDIHGALLPLVDGMLLPLSGTLHFQLRLTYDSSGYSRSGACDTPPLWHGGLVFCFTTMVMFHHCGPFLLVQLVGRSIMCSSLMFVSCGVRLLYCSSKWSSLMRMALIDLLVLLMEFHYVVHGAILTLVVLFYPS